MEFALHLEVNLGHLPTPLNNLSAEAFPSLLFQPGLQQAGENLAAPAGRYVLFEGQKRVGRQRIGSFQ